MRGGQVFLLPMVNMIIGAWNIRGLNTSIKNKEVKHLLKRYNIQFFGVLETRIRPGNLEKFLHYYRDEWKIENSDSVES